MAEVVGAEAVEAEVVVAEAAGVEAVRREAQTPTRFLTEHRADHQEPTKAIASSRTSYIHDDARRWRKAAFLQGLSSLAFCAITIPSLPHLMPPIFLHTYSSPMYNFLEHLAIKCALSWIQAVRCGKLLRYDLTLPF